MKLDSEASISYTEKKRERKQNCMQGQRYIGQAVELCVHACMVGR
jgi:hypothetical protein